MAVDLGPTPEQLARMRSNIFIELATRRRRSRRRIVGFSVALVVAISTSAAAIAITRASNDYANTTFDCFSAADLSADHITTGPVDDERDAFTLLPLPERVAAASRACETSWSAVPDGSGVSIGPADVVNPTACVLADDRLGVFPNPDRASTDSFCEALGASAPRS